MPRSSAASAFDKITGDFEAMIGEIVNMVSSASGELGTLTTTAERSEELTTMVAAASEEATTNVQSVASATEEMASSVNEISRQVQDSARIAGEAVGQAQRTNDRVGELARLDPAAIENDRHPLIIGIGGAVRRSRGTEDPSGLGHHDEIAASAWKIAERSRAQ